MFTPKSALFTFFAACALGVVACQPVDGSPQPLAADSDAAKVAGTATHSPAPAPAR